MLVFINFNKHLIKYDWNVGKCSCARKTYFDSTKRKRTNVQHDSNKFVSRRDKAESTKSLVVPSKK